MLWSIFLALRTIWRKPAELESPLFSRGCPRAISREAPKERIFWKKTSLPMVFIVPKMSAKIIVLIKRSLLIAPVAVRLLWKRFLKQATDSAAMEDVSYPVKIMRVFFWMNPILTVIKRLILMCLMNPELWDSTQKILKLIRAKIR